MPSPRPSAFSWKEAWMQHRDCLPHLRQTNALYFVTFRLADSLPASYLKKLIENRDSWLRCNPPPHTEKQRAEYRRIWSLPLEQLLDTGHGRCELKDPSCRAPLEATFLHDDGKTYQLGDYVIMPNHVHALVHVVSGQSLSKVLQAWKSISARAINRQARRRGAVWQPEPFDHIVRDEFHWRKFVRYIRNNPVKLPRGMFTLGCGTLKLKEEQSPIGDETYEMWVE